MDQKALGIHGEQLAVGHLRSLGYTILCANWRFGKIELDIIASNNQVISFIEVKTRENNYLGEPWQSVTVAKQRRIIKAANHYIVENQVDLECRFDIVSIIHNSKYTNIEHMKDAFYAMV
jgi:putative endonuclease